jgi:hypothetical protein
MQPKFLPLPLAQAKNGQKQFWKYKFHAAIWKAHYALMNDPIFFLLKEGGQGIFFPIVLNVFP